MRRVTKDGHKVTKAFGIFLILIFLAPNAFAQREQRITISDLLEQGYDIVAIACDEDGPSDVYLKKRSRAYLCRTLPRNSICYSLNDHSE